jgi:hypothetical protein
MSILRHSWQAGVTDIKVNIRNWCFRINIDNSHTLDNHILTGLHNVRKPHKSVFVQTETN